MRPSTEDTIHLLRAASAGDAAAVDRLTPTLYSELRNLAGSYLKRERQGHTLQPTELVHEAFLRLVDSDSANDRNHFFALTAGTMRRVLVDHARKRQSVKRGSGGQQVTLSTALISTEGAHAEILDMDRALEKLAAVDPQAARLVELRYFGGLTCEEAAEVMDVSITTVERKWRAARTWLRRELASGTDGAGA